MRNRRLFSYNSAFTLIELLVVVLIIGLLTAIATTNYMAAQKRARDNARKTQVNNIATAVESYYAAKHVFPGKALAIEVPSSNYNNDYLNCETVQGSNIIYYYYPFQAGASDSCDQRANLAPYYNKLDYKPFPLWIPGMGDFLTSIPVENNFMFSNGSTTPGTGNVVGNVLTASENGVDKTRTLVYQKLSGGYAVYDRLENQSTDKDAFTNTNQVCQNLNATGANIYVVCK